LDGCVIAFQAQTLSLQTENTTYWAVEVDTNPNGHPSIKRELPFSTSFLRASNHQMPAGYSPDLVTIQLSNCLVTCHNTKKSNLKEKCRTSGISIQPYESRVQAIIILVHTIPLYQTI
jgi:hypothetical protein